MTFLEAMQWVSRAAMVLGLVPLIWLVARVWWRQEHPYAEWWLLGCAYAVSWLADTMAQYVTHALSATAYPLLQCGLILAVLLSKRDALTAIGTFAVVGMASVLVFGPTSHVALMTVTSLAVTGIVWPRKDDLGPLRWALLTTFGLGWLAWMGFQLNPVSFAPWIGYQVTRAVGTALLCRAMTVQSSVRFG